MGDENLGGGMNLDLNLGTGSLSPETNDTTTSVNLEDWIEGQHLPTNLLRETSRSRIWRWHSLWSGTGTAASASPAPVPFEARSIASEFILNTATLNGDFLHTGEGSERNTDVVKECKNEGVGIEDEGKIGKNEEEEKEGGNEGSFFECNICLDVSSDPVLTCCGHLFCWPCLYQWINVHSDSKECPVCKGEVTVKNLTPIYGRGSSTTNEHISSLKIPDRPQAKRVESWRQTIQRNAFAFPMDEMLRRLGSGSDFSRDFIENHPPGTDSVTELIERNSSLLNRILTSRGMRQEQTLTPPQEDADDVDLTNTRSHTYRGVPTGEIVNIARRFVGYTGGGRGEEQALPVEDRDSVSSIAAVIHSESQTLDTAVEIDSTVSLSTSSSRRRVDASRVSDVDSGDSRAPRRRRFN